jgi:hypothetical protein
LGVIVLLGTLPGASLAAQTPGAVATNTSDPSLFVPDPSLHQANQLAKAQGGLGAYRDATTRQIVVRMPKAVAANFAAADIASVGAPVDVRASAFDSASIAAMESEVEGLYTRLAGSQTIVSGYDIRQDLFAIRSDAPESVFADFEAKYPGKVAYTYGGVVLQDNRDNDGVPHYGGATLDLIVNGVLTPWCTSGYAIKVGATIYMVTAGHCYAGGATVYGGTGLNWGTIKSRRDWPNTDVELIGGTSGGTSYAGYIYVSYSTWQAVKGYTVSDPGASPYCVSGHAGNTHCDYEDYADNLTITFGNGQTTSGLVELVGYGTVPGDSGGPAYATTGGNAFILGSTVGGSPTCSPLPSSCIVFIEPWSTRVQSVYGASLVGG